MSTEMTQVVNVNVASGDPLTPAEAKRYERLKAQFSKWYEDRFAAGDALREIRDSRLYRQEHPTFEVFCEKEYGVSRSRAYRLIEAAEVKAGIAMSPMGNSVTNERQARALNDVPESEREEVLKR